MPVPRSVRSHSKDRCVSSLFSRRIDCRRLAPRIESSPPLSDTEIASVLGSYVYSDESGQDRPDLRSTLALTGDILARLTVIGDLERALRETLAVDLFAIRSQILQNLVFDRLNVVNNELDGVVSLGDYLNNTTIFIGKYLTDDLFLEFLLQFNTNNAGSGEGVFGITPEIEFGLEMATPLFLMRWTFFPRNPQRLFLVDHTFEFSWEFEY